MFAAANQRPLHAPGTCFLAEKLAIRVDYSDAQYPLDGEATFVSLRISNIPPLCCFSPDPEERRVRV